MKKFWISLTVLLVAIITGLTVFIATNFKTTAQQEAEASPPATSEITAEVTQQKLQNTLPVVCSATFGETTQLAVNGAGPSGQYTLIAVNKDEEIRQGSLLAEVNGKPIFAGIGGFSFYRDLKLKDAGPDARMLNEILSELGYQTGRSVDEADAVDEVTFQALSSLYEAHGYGKVDPKEGFAASSFIVLKHPQTVISEPRKTGAVADGPIAQLSSKTKKLQCAGTSGELSPEAQTGQKLIVPALDNQEFTVTVGTMQSGSNSATNTENSESASTGHNVAPAQGANGQGNGEEGKRYATVDANEVFSSLQGQIPASLVLSESSDTLPVVPSAAIWTKDQQAVVTVVEGAEHREVPVKVVFSAEGYNQVEPLEGQKLPVGTLVKVFANQG